MSHLSLAIERGCAQATAADFTPHVPDYDSPYRLLHGAQVQEVDSGRYVSHEATTESYADLLATTDGTPIGTQAEAIDMLHEAVRQRISAENALHEQGAVHNANTQLTLQTLRNTTAPYYQLPRLYAPQQISTGTFTHDNHQQPLLVTVVSPHPTPESGNHWDETQQVDLVVTDLNRLALRDPQFVSNQLRIIHQAAARQELAWRTYHHIESHRLREHTPAILQELGALSSTARAAAGLIMRQVASLPIGVGASTWSAHNERFAGIIDQAYRAHVPEGSDSWLGGSLRHRANCPAEGEALQQQAAGEVDVYDILQQTRYQHTLPAHPFAPIVQDMLHMPTVRINHVLSPQRLVELQAEQETAARRLAFMQAVLEAPADPAHCLQAIETHLPEAHNQLVQLREQCGPEAFEGFIRSASSPYAYWSTDKIRMSRDQLESFRSAFHQLTYDHRDELSFTDAYGSLPKDSDLRYALRRLVDVTRIQRAEAEQVVPPGSDNLLVADLRAHPAGLQWGLRQLPAWQEGLAARRQTLAEFQAETGITDADLAAYIAMNETTSEATTPQLAMLGTLLLTRLGIINPDQPGVRSLLSAIYDPEAEHREAINTMWQQIIQPQN